MMRGSPLQTACYPTRSDSMMPADIEQPEKRMRTLWTAALLLAVSLVFGGCGGGGVDWTNEDTYTPPGNTWTDPTTGFEWQVTPTGGFMNWSEAKAHCAGLSLDGGGWHLPSIGELRTLIRGCPATEDGGSCNVEEGDCLLAWSCRDSSCSGCSDFDGPADGCYWPDEMQGICGAWYCSSSPVMDSGHDAWFVSFSTGFVFIASVSLLVRCVR